MSLLNITVIHDESGQIFTYQIGADEPLENLKSLLEVDLKIPLSKQLISLNGKIIQGDQISLSKVGLKNNDLLYISEQKQRIQQQNYQQNPLQGIDILKIPTKDIIKLLKSNQNLLSQFPPEFQKAILDNNEKLVDQALQPAREKLKHEELMRRIEIDPFDIEAQKHLEELIQKGNIEENMQNAMEYTPESFARVIMLYIDATVNNTPVKAFVDSGAQMTIMSKACAEKCGLMRLLDTRFSGVAKGVGTAKILGRIHLTKMIIGKSHFDVTITVLDQGGIEFLLGLDMLRKHACTIDLAKNVLVIGKESAPFLQEKDLPIWAKEEYEKSPVPKKEDQKKPNQQQKNVDPEKVKKLMEFGFLKEACEQALIMANGNIEVAAGILYGQ